MNGMHLGGWGQPVMRRFHYRGPTAPVKDPCGAKLVTHACKGRLVGVRQEGRGLPAHCQHTTFPCIECGRDRFADVDVKQIVALQAGQIATLEDRVQGLEKKNKTERDRNPWRRW